MLQNIRTEPGSCCAIVPSVAIAESDSQGLLDPRNPRTDNRQRRGEQTSTGL